MKLLIHDLEPERAEFLFPEKTPDRGWLAIADDGSLRCCIGCFGCWVKTPGACLIRDKYGDMGRYLSRSEEVFLVSRCSFGGPSPFVKGVLDRSISYIHPYFTDRNGGMHHQRRYQNHILMGACFYGTGLTAGEKRTAEDWLRAAAVNLDAKMGLVEFREEGELI